ncbi:MAG TPA: hypothetical protein VNF07_00770 [Acidimicrobiales bacterium]|nr:hypothetical protein [Acidimicrobiales bacterium]
MNAEWRAGHGADAVLIRDDSGAVREAVEANPKVLTRFLTNMGDLSTWKGNLQVVGNEHNPEAWGQLVIARAATGEVLNMDPERYWDGIYSWYRSRGVDYDSDRAASN